MSSFSRLHSWEALAAVPSGEDASCACSASSAQHGKRVCQHGCTARRRWLRCHQLQCPAHPRHVLGNKRLPEGLHLVQHP